MRLRLFSLSISITGLCVCLLCACARDETPSPTEKITLATPRVQFSEMIFLAQREGLFAREGLNLHLILTDSGKEALDLMLAGKADFSTAASVSLVTAIMDGAKPIMLATICRSDTDNALIARSDRGITSEENLKEKKIGVPFNTGAQLYLHHLLAEAGVSEKNVQIVNLPPSEAVQALADGKVDAVVLDLPWHIQTKEVVGSNAVVLAPKLYTTHWIMTANRESMQSHPEVASRILNAIQAAKILAARAPERAHAANADTALPSKEEISQRQRHYKDFVYLPQSMVISMENEARWHTALNSRASNNVPIPNFLDYIDPGPLKKIQPESVRITH